MTTSPRTKSLRILRTLAVAAIVGFIIFAALWYTVFSAVTAALVASGGTVVLVAGASASDVFETIFEMLATIILTVLAAIGAFFAAIFSIFD